MAITTTVRVTNNVNTTDPILPRRPVPQAGAPAPADQRRQLRAHQTLLVVGIILTSILFAAGVVGGLVRLPYDSIGPGSTRAVNGLVTVRGHETYPPEGEILYATVAVRERVNGLQALVGWLDPDTDVIPEEDLRGDIPPDQYRRLNVEAMNDSKTTAEVVALSHLGYTNLGAGAEIVSVAPGSPAAAVLQPKDVILAIDGNRVSTSGDVVSVIRARQPGDTIRLQVAREHQPPMETEATLTTAEDGRPLLGVRLNTKVQLPFEITIDSGSVVGPSAGLSYALELLDVLTPGELTGGMKVAATGELLPNGEIGPIGGVAQKVVSVERAGVKVFLVPEANEPEAKSRAGDGIEVVGVSDFEDALQVLGSIQGSNASTLASPSPAA